MEIVLVLKLMASGSVLGETSKVAPRHTLLTGFFNGFMFLNGSFGLKRFLFFS